MKTIGALLIAGLLAGSMAMAEPASILGGTAVGYDWVGPGSGEMNTLVWCAPRIKTITKGMYLYAGYQYGKVGAVAQHGAKMILVEKSHIPHLWMLFDVGWLNHVNAGDPGLTVGGGPVYGITERMSIILYGMAIDEGPDFGFAVYFGVGVDDLWGLANDIIK